MPDLDALLSEADGFVATRGEPRRDTDLVKRLAAALEASRPSLATVEAVTRFLLAEFGQPVALHEGEIGFEEDVWVVGHQRRIAEALVARFAFPVPVVTEEMVERAAEADSPLLFSGTLGEYERHYDNYGEETRRIHQKQVLGRVRAILSAVLTPEAGQ